MNKINFIVTACMIIFTLAACGDEKKATSPTPDNSKVNSAQDVNIPQASIPNPDIPQASIPKPKIPPLKVPPVNIPKTKIPDVNFPEINFPQVNFPEITIPNVKIQQGKNTTIYTVPADILFDFDKANIRPDAQVALEQISKSISQRFANPSMQINGHTDAIGSDTYNLGLSQRRAEAVRQWLITNKNMKPNLMTVKGLGETQPVAPNTNPNGSDNPQGRQKNRRVEIVVRAG